MSPLIVFIVLSAYFGMLILIARYTSVGADNRDFFTAGRGSSWYLVAFGMIGASLSGVTFISVPGWVASSSFSYLQMVLGYLLGYAFIAGVLMPVYYRMNLVSIYRFLDERFGYFSHKTGAGFFLLSRLAGSAARLYLVTEVLQIFLFDEIGIPFFVTAAVALALIWIYTHRGGIKTIVITDTLQTFFMLAAVVLTLGILAEELNFSFAELPGIISENDYSRIFFFDDANDKKYFFKQFLAGAFIAVAMTGLDQDMMQKNLTCRNLADAQKNIFWFSIVLVFVNLLFLSLGVMLYLFAEKNGISLPEKSDQLYPMLAKSYLGLPAAVLFLLGVTAAAYSSADSALTALTTSFCADILDFEKIERSEARQTLLRRQAHVLFTVLTYITILIFRAFNETNVISAVFTIAGYTYGPLLGLFIFGLFVKNVQVHDRFVPIVCLLSPVLTYVLSANSEAWFNGYVFGFELLIINGLITFLGLVLLIKKEQKHAAEI